jgi:hypothetical protein
MQMTRHDPECDKEREGGRGISGGGGEVGGEVERSAVNTVPTVSAHAPENNDSILQAASGSKCVRENSKQRLDDGLDGLDLRRSCCSAGEGGWEVGWE